jgi:hypothetical protein
MAHDGCPHATAVRHGGCKAVAAVGILQLPSATVVAHNGWTSNRRGPQQLVGKSEMFRNCPIILQNNLKIYKKFIRFIQSAFNFSCCILLNLKNNTRITSRRYNAKP